MRSIAEPTTTDELVLTPMPLAVDSSGKFLTKTWHAIICDMRHASTELHDAMHSRGKSEKALLRKMSFEVQGLMRKTCRSLPMTATAKMTAAAAANLAIAAAGGTLLLAQIKASVLNFKVSSMLQKDVVVSRINSVEKTF